MAGTVRGSRSFSGVFAQVVHDGAGRGEGMQVVVEAKDGELGDAELFAQDAVGVIVLEGPVVNAAFDAAGAVEEGIFGSFKELRWAGEKCFARMQELEFVAEGVFGALTGELGRLKFAG